MSFWTSHNSKSQELEKLKEELSALRERAELLDSSCGVGLWQAVLHNADAFDPKSAWTWSPEFRRLLGYSSEVDFPNVSVLVGPICTPKTWRRLSPPLPTHLKDEVRSLAVRCHVPSDDEVGWLPLVPCHWRLPILR